MKIVMCSIPAYNPSLRLTPSERDSREAVDLPLMPKYAIVSLAQWMERNGYKPNEYDFYDIDMMLPSDDEIRAYFLKVKPYIVGLSGVTSGSYGQVKRVARIIRNVCPDTMIVLGGNLAASANVVIRKTDVDICVVGDGEIAWVKLLDYTKQYGRNIVTDALSVIKGLSFLNASGDLMFTGYGEKLPDSEMCLVADYDLLRRGLQDRPELMSYYFTPGRESAWFNHDPRAYESGRRPNISYVMVNKGCVAKCTFCQRATKGYRSGDLLELEKSIVYLKENHAVGFIFVADENFGSDKEIAVGMAGILKKHDMLWAAGGVRADSVTRELIHGYAKNNCVAMKFGIESGSQKILDIMEKKLKREQVVNAVKWCREFKLFSPLAIMFGMPGETEMTAKETGQLLGENAVVANSNPCEKKDIFYAIPFPGTPLYEYGQQVGVIGTTAEEEEIYLANVFSSFSYKSAYPNLNGAPIGEVLFWDVLAQMEAMRYFAAENGQRKDEAQHSLSATPICKPLKQKMFGKESLLEAVIRKIRTRRFGVLSMHPLATNFIQRKIVPSISVAKAPRALVYPMVKALLLLEFCIIYFLTRKSRSRNYKDVFPGKGVKRIGNDYQMDFPSRRLVSLRHIVLSNRTSPTNVTEVALEKLSTGL